MFLALGVLNKQSMVGVDCLNDAIFSRSIAESTSRLRMKFNTTSLPNFSKINHKAGAKAPRELLSSPIIERLKCNYFSILDICVGNPVSWTNFASGYFKQSTNNEWVVNFPPPQAIIVP